MENKLLWGYLAQVSPLPGELARLQHSYYTVGVRARVNNEFLGVAWHNPPETLPPEFLVRVDGAKPEQVKEKPTFSVAYLVSERVPSKWRDGMSSEYVLLAPWTPGELPASPNTTQIRQRYDIGWIVDALHVESGRVVFVHKRANDPDNRQPAQYIGAPLEKGLAMYLHGMDNHEDPREQRKAPRIVTVVGEDRMAETIRILDGLNKPYIRLTPRG